ncbi:hypothetical protein Gotur_008293, partial [Gossypium turneri]
MKDDTDLGDKVVTFGKLYEFFDIFRYPSQQKVAYRIDDRVPVNVSGNGVYNFTLFHSTRSSILSVIRSVEETQESLGDTEGKCLNAKLVTSTLQSSAYGLTNNVVLVGCSPLGEPVKCSTKDSNCTITNSYGAFPDRTVCRAWNVVYPTSEQELVFILVCPDGQDGLLISTKNLNRVVNINLAAMTMTVESGVTLRQLINEAAKAGLALPYAPYWWGLTIGGLLGTEAYGSSLWEKGSSVHDY